jgi:metal-responsive CopG/Arc/MetJ family transcriptional regulator
MKKKKKITVTIDKGVLKKIEELTTNKSRLIEYILLDYLNKNNVDIKNIIL